jgi:phytoene/squalene synthetase
MGLIRRQTVQSRRIPDNEFETFRAATRIALVRDSEGDEWVQYPGGTTGTVAEFLLRGAESAP